jgi:hypothetical protein
MEGTVVSLNGSASYDRNGDGITYQWRQVSGPSATLIGPNVAQPAIVAPSGLSADVVLEFELIVGDGAVLSAPDAVRVTVRRSGG